jgi:tetratricopeptide (TPR) repeat protein
MQNQDETVEVTPEPSGDYQKNNIRTLEESMPAETVSEQNSSPETPKKRMGWGRRIILGILVFILIVVLGGAIGYGRAIIQRVQQEERMIATAVYDQFLLGIVNMERGEYELARQRFEYILQLDPGHTQAAELLTEALLHLGETSELPTPRPSPTTAPTPDTRNQEEIFVAALALRDAKQWDALIASLDTLRIADYEYKTIEVDGLYYIAYRNRGIFRIVNDANLEGGIFDLTRAEAFGPLDIEASNYRVWAEKYITGTSFWGVDWTQVLYYFDDLAVSAPNLRDSSFLTSLDRQATARVEKYTEFLVTAGYRFNQGKYCEAYDLYNEASLYIILDDANLQRFEAAKNSCLGIPPTATATPEGTTEETPEP